MYRVTDRFREVQGRGHVVGDSGRGEQLGGAFAGFPYTEEFDEEVVREARVEHLADEEDVAGQCGLQHDRHVGGVEQADGVRASHPALAVRFDGDFDAEALEVDDRCEDD